VVSLSVAPGQKELETGGVPQAVAALPDCIDPWEDDPGEIAG